MNCLYSDQISKTRYHPENFRLIRLLTSRNTGQDILQDLNYEYDAEGNITAITDAAQETIFHDNQMIEARSTYSYDALYRLISATGRELSAIETIEKVHTWTYVKNGVEGIYSVMGNYDIATHKTINVFPNTIRYISYETRQYD